MYSKGDRILVFMAFNWQPATVVEVKDTTRNGVTSYKVKVDWDKPAPVLDGPWICTVRNPVRRRLVSLGGAGG